MHSFVIVTFLTAPETTILADFVKVIYITYMNITRRKSNEHIMIMRNSGRNVVELIFRIALTCPTCR